MISEVFLPVVDITEDVQALANQSKLEELQLDRSKLQEELAVLQASHSEQQKVAKAQLSQAATQAKAVRTELEDASREKRFKEIQLQDVSAQLQVGCFTFPSSITCARHSNHAEFIVVRLCTWILMAAGKTG